ncbi:hypothetical protein RO3G_06901 [Rhizopus delemar RA 99-880]|uniref:Uncharacterized protein n=1 Tax=Rhizopus delemar (strain RA 99-880 / ATCC MYA-4621 / FGSC 9543 / NRRL 43880) TaxID=246409 RepID=I1C166_RHIO9|nr:hypothetical protein RO3G_06901 [Rhizopus delemar RA 99-880]|eukprot:EIE82196.1 hypothetical protein RO3G_06901 [Rhizopus delemar RA 99-880]
MVNKSRRPKLKCTKYTSVQQQEGSNGTRLCIPIGDKVDCRVCTQNSDDNGLNAANKLGSLRLPSTGLDMRKARTLIERLFTTKKDAKYLAKCHTILSNGVALALKSTNQKQNNKRSPYDKEQDDEIKSGHYCAWIRGSWFPPLQKKDKPYYGQYPPGLFKH